MEKRDNSVFLADLQEWNLELSELQIAQLEKYYEMLVEKNKKKGRQMGDTMMERFRNELPQTYELAVKQYKIFRMMNRLHISKRTWEKISHSRVYNKLRKNHSFD